MQKMKAVTITGVKQAEIREYEMPKVGPNDVLIEIKACALCTLEQRIYTGVKDVGGFPVIGGHEASGIVIETGRDVRNCKVGQHVVSTDPYCGQCYYCRKGMASQCHYGIADAVYNLPDGTINVVGYLAQYVSVDASRVIVLGDQLPFEQAALTEPLACCLHSVNKGELQIGDVAVVIGAGIMGILHTKLAKLRGAIVIVAEVDEARRQKALDAGADYVFSPLEEDPKAFVQNLSRGLGANVVYNTTAVDDAWQQGFQMLAPYGKILAYSSRHPDTPIPVQMGEVHSSEIQIIGTVSPNEYDMLNAAWIMDSGLISVEDVIQHKVPFDTGYEAYEKSIVPGAYRVVVMM